MTAPMTESPEGGSPPDPPSGPRRSRGRVGVLVGIAVLVIVGVVLLVAGLVGVGTPRAAAPVSAPDARPPVTVSAGPAPTTTSAPDLPASPPKRIAIPAIGVDSAVNPIGLNPDGTSGSRAGPALRRGGLVLRLGHPRPARAVGHPRPHRLRGERPVGVLRALAAAAAGRVHAHPRGRPHRRLPRQLREELSEGRVPEAVRVRPDHAPGGPARSPAAERSTRRPVLRRQHGGLRQPDQPVQRRPSLTL